MGKAVILAYLCNFWLMMVQLGGFNEEAQFHIELPFIHCCTVVCCERKRQKSDNFACARETRTFPRVLSSNRSRQSN